MRRISRKLLIGLPAGALLVGSVLAIGLARRTAGPESLAASQPPMVRVAPARVRPYAFTERHYASAQAWQQVNLSFELVGTVSSIPVAEGQFIEANTPVILLDAGELNAELATRQAAKAEAESSEQLAGCAIKEAEAGKHRYDFEVSRLRELAASSRASEVELARAEADAHTAEAALNRTRALLVQAQARKAMAEAEIGLARARLEKLTLKSPIAGYLTEVTPEVGESVSPGVQVARVLDLSHFKVVLGVADSNIGKFRENQRVILRFESLDSVLPLAKLGVPTVLSPQGRLREPLAEPFVGHVCRVPEQAALNRQFPVEVDVPNRFIDVNGRKAPVIRPGMIAEVQVVIDERPLLAVPHSATVKDADGLAAFFLKPSTPKADEGRPASGEPALARVKRVSLEGAIPDGDVYLLADLPEGLGSLVVAGQHGLTDGAAVRVVSEESDGDL